MSIELRVHESAYRSRSIEIVACVEYPPNGGTDVRPIGSVHQGAYAHEKFDPPRVQFSTSSSHSLAEWRELNAAVEKAFHAFRQRWPEE
jgi:hypothetical protein